MASYKISCITKPNAQSRHEHITHVGGTADADGSGWKNTRENVVSFIKAKTHTFYTSVGGNTAEVGVHPDLLSGVYGLGRHIPGVIRLSASLTPATLCAPAWLQTLPIV